MKHYLLNITWKCQLQCSYCWVRKSINTNPVLDAQTTRPLEDWINAVERDQPEMLTIGGGEPLTVPWVFDLIRSFPYIKWNLSTNGLVVSKINDLASTKFVQINNINLSYHPEAADKYPWYFSQWKREILKLAESGYNISSNIENINDNVEKSQAAIEFMQSENLPMLISPICGGREELSRPQDIPLICEGGVNHLVIAPNGDAWPCQTAINSYAWKETCLGNWLDGTLDLSHKPIPCNLYCVDWFHQYKEHQAGDFFGLKVREDK
jgi:organic radical activating enzyme